MFFSEYGEGSSNNKWLEIYNGTGGDIDLSVYTIALYSNGSTTPFYTLTLSGTLAAGDVYVIRNASAAIQAVIDAADLVDGAYPNGVTFFNGNDVVTLSKDGTVIDIIGLLGDDTDFAKDVTIVRNSDVRGPNATFDITEWTVNATDYADNVGTHTVS